MCLNTSFGRISLILMDNDYHDCTYFVVFFVNMSVQFPQTAICLLGLLDKRRAFALERALTDILIEQTILSRMYTTQDKISRVIGGVFYANSADASKISFVGFQYNNRLKTYVSFEFQHSKTKINHPHCYFGCLDVSVVLPRVSIDSAVHCI